MMRNKRGNNLFVKVVTGLLAIILVMGVVYLVKLDEKYVLAAENNGDVVKLEDTEIDYKVKEYSDISDYRIKDATGNFKVPTLTTAELVEAQDTTPGEWLFAGWYTNEVCTTSLSSSVVYTEGAAVNNGPYYAKFVPADVLSVKCQITAGTESVSPETVLRCISTVDSLKYKGIGLQLVRPDGTVGKMENNKVNTRIKARTDIDVEAYSYSPKVVDTESEYFFSATEVINQENFGDEYIVKPYWITKDGTTVWGVSRCVTVNEAINKDATCVPVKMTTAPAENATLTANDGTTDHTLTYSGKYDADTGYAHFELAIDLSSLKSLTNYTITGSGVNASYAYRNLNTKVTGITTGIPTSANGTDQSWYTIANGLGEDEFVIATDADFYGLAEIVNTTEESFADETIYLVSDITMNKGYANPSAGSSAWSTSLAEDGTTSITDGTNRSWNAIGSKSDAFAGVFDGQMHSISGIYMESGVSGSGLFGGTTTTAKLRNFRLENSFFKFTKPSGNGAYQSGSIVGFGLGELDTIYSNAVIRPGINYAGGMVGTAGDDGSLSIKNCWFDGNISVYQAASYVGGFVGLAQSGGTTIENCLNTGSITNKNANTPGVGGLVGYVSNNADILTISHCMNMGVLQYDTTRSNVVSFGLLVGHPMNETEITISDSYSTTQEGWSLVANKDQSDTTNAVIENSTVIGAESAIAGEKALTTSAMTSLFSTTTEAGTTESYWAIVPGHGPALASFAETVYGTAQAIDTSWYASSKSTYTLSDMADFYGFAMLSKSNPFEGKTIRLSKDIATKNEGDAEDWATTAPDYEWIGIGDSSSVFAGNFDGQGHEISGIYISSMSGVNRGLFREVNTEGTIEDFRLRNSYICGTEEKIGSIAGTVTDGTFNNISSDAVVACTATSNVGNVGGLIGYVAGDLAMNNCWFKGSVTNNAGQVNGGLIGRVNAANKTITISNCLNSGTITTYTSHSSGSYTGGLVGYKYAGTLEAKYSLNTGTISTPNTTERCGLIVGSGSYTATQVYSVAVEGVSDPQESADGIFEANEIYGTTAMDKMPAFYTPILENGKYLTYWAVTDTTPVLSSFAEYATDAEGNTISAIAIDTSWYDASKEIYTLNDAGDFYGFALLSKLTDVNGFATKTIKLGADIVISNTGEVANWSSVENAPNFSWTSIGTIDLPFNGTFDGKNHEISGIYLKESSSYQGMFVATGADAEIKNFYLKNSYFETTTTDSKGGQLGSIVGNAQGTFKTIYSDAIVKGYCNRVGGLIGATSTSGGVTMSDCWFDGSATINSAASYLGGLIGNVAADSSITNCLNTGEVYHKYSVSTNGAGGFAGWVGSSITLDISYSVNTSNVKTTAGKYYGLFVGKADGTVNATYCHSINYSGKNQVGNDSSGTNPYDTCTRQTATNIAGSKSLTTDKVKELFTAEVAKDYWAITPDSLPVLTSLAEKAGITAQAVDTSWYDASKTEFTLMDSGDLYGLAVLSKLTDVDGFTGKTIKLGADIEINSGNAADWATTAPDYGWIGIGSDSNYFKGTFDGGLYTVRGIYFNDSQSVGLFVATDEGSTIQKLKLENSYFEASGIRCGSIAATGKGNFYMIYSDSIVIGSGNYIGGLVGITAGEIVIENCWFDGTVTNTGTAAQYTGGLVGRVNSGNITLKNCLNSAPVSSSYNTINDNSQIVIAVGGLVGSVASEEGTKLEVNASMNVGKVNYSASSTDETVQIRGYGPIVGFSSNPAAATIYATYATTESCTETDKSNITANFATVSESDIKGNDAKTAMPLLGWDVDWECVDGEFPAIIFSTTGFGEVVDNTATASDKILLSNLYDGRTLYQGEAHDHADNGGSSDGTVSLADWKTQMTDTTSESYVDLDFAASLDHRQTWHINHTDWDRDMFIYGTEAATTLTDNNATFHYNMYFTEKQDLIDVLNSNDKFSYDATKDNDESTKEAPAFTYPNLAIEEFKTLIQAVKDKGGFFSLPHPYLYYESDNAMDYFFADGIGFEVFYNTLSGEVTKQNYKIWTELLAEGKHVWACAGNDGHANLSTDALTSIYAKKLDSEKYLSEAYVRNMSKGAFTAGSVGIQMCINETQMGGSCDFNGQRLVVGIPQGAFHESILTEGSKYRVEILNEDGVVYSQEISNDNDTYLAFNADESSMFYRVEVYNATTGLCIAIGNPIWNN